MLQLGSEQRAPRLSISMAEEVRACGEGMGDKWGRGKVRRLYGWMEPIRELLEGSGREGLLRS